MCVLIPLQEASSQLAIPTELSVVGDSSKTTTTTDTDDIEFTVRVKRLKLGFFVYSATISVSSSPATLTAVPDAANVFGLALNAHQDVKVTVARDAITTAGAGTYTITFTADEFFVFNFPGIDPISIDLTLTVVESVTQTYGVTVDVQGSATQTTTTAGTADIEYTIRVTNTGSGSDSFTLSHSGVTDAELSETSLSNISASAYEDVTLTVPRSALADVDTYTVTVTATSDGDSNETDDTETETIVNEPTVYGLTLLNVGDLTRTTQNTDTDDITYTLRVTNIGNSQDTIDLTKEGHRADQVTLSQDSLALAADTAADVTVTLPRSALDVLGTYRLLVTATSQGDSSKQAALTMTTTVTDGSIPALRYDTIEIEVLEGLRQTSKTTDTEDVTYTLRITNISVFSFHEVNFTVSGDIGAATITPASVELFADDAVIEIIGYGSKVEYVTLTIPRNVLSRGGNYITTVTAVPDIGLTKTVTVRTIVNLSGTLALEGVGSLTQTTQNTDTDDITYTLRVTNTSDTIDQVELTASGDVDTATLDPTSVVLEAGTYDDVTLTIPRAALSDAGTYSVPVTATSEKDSTVIAIVTTQTIITDDSLTPTDPTEPTEQTETTETTETTEQTLSDKSTHTVVFSEFMFESVGGEDRLPQWIEVYNNSAKEINLNGWKLKLKRLQSVSFEVTTTFKEDFIIPVEQSRLIVTSLGRHSGGGKLSDDDVYQLNRLHAEELAQNDIENSNRLITRDGFSLKLINPKDVLIDHISTLTGDKQTWQLHECLIDGVRTSLIRRFDEGVPRSGTERGGWYRAFDAKRLVVGIYYGHSQDLGTPAYRRGKPLPVELSQFSARLVKDEVVIDWTTESELNNAGFNILRSTSRTKNFRPINTKLIKGAGTTGERNTYQFIDKTAKPNVAYYYRIEDIDFSGIREVLTTYQLRGVIAPTGKFITKWSTLKGDR